MLVVDTIKCRGRWGTIKTATKVEYGLIVKLFVLQCSTLRYKAKYMPPSDTTISIRLPKETRKALDEAAKATRRSRAFLMKEALERHLEAIKREQSPADRKAAFQRLLALKGTGIGPEGYRTAEEIDALIREIRGDD